MTLPEGCSFSRTGSRSWTKLCRRVAMSVVGRARPVGAALRVEADDLLEADADPHEVGRQVVEVQEGAVPGEQVEVAVDHRDALARVVEGVLEEVAAVLDRRGGVVEELEGLARGDVAAAQQQREREPRRGGAPIAEARRCSA